MKRKGTKIRRVRETTYDLDQRLTALEKVVGTLVDKDKPKRSPASRQKVAKIA